MNGKNIEINNNTSWNKNNKIFSTEPFSGIDTPKEMPDIERKIKKIYKRKKIRQHILPLKNIYDPSSDENNDDTNITDILDNNIKESIENKCSSCDNNNIIINNNNDDTDDNTDDDSDNDTDNDDDNNDINYISTEGFIEGARGKKKRKNKNKKSSGGIFQKAVGTIKNGFDKAIESIFILGKIGKKGMERASEEITNMPALSGYDNLNNDLKMKNNETNAEYKIRISKLKTQIENKNKDKETLTNIIYMSIIFPLCIWFSYNWYYLIIYRDGDGGRPDDDEKRYKIDFGVSVLNEIFQYALYPVKSFDKYILSDNGLPEIIKNHKSMHVFYRFLTLIFSVFLVYYIGISGDPKSITKGIPWLIYYAITILVVFYFFISVFPKITEYFLQFGGVLVTGPLVGGFVFICMFFIMLSLCAMTIPIAVVLFILFMWIHSLFGIFIYRNNSTVSQNIHEMEIHIKQSIAELEDKDIKIHEPDLMRRFMKSTSKFLNENMYTFVYLCILIYNLIYAHINLLSIPLKSTITVLLASLVGIFSMWIGNYFLKNIKPFIKEYIATKESVHYPNKI